MRLWMETAAAAGVLVAALHILPAEAARPNVVLLLVDDGGFMDFGGFGGEAHTPTIDRLADAGVRFSNYHTSPLCAPSRAMLLTGLDSHRTGVGTIPEVLTEAQRAAPAYALHLHPELMTIAERLRDAGYQTFMTGKWHLGRGPGDLPDSHGFDRSFALDASGADNWEQKSFLPFYADAPWFEDGSPAKLPDDFYSSRFIVDKMLEYLAGRDSTAPFFAYLAFQAVHIPVQAPREFTERYRGVYADGWDAVRTRRWERARALGLVPADAEPPLPHPDLRPWASLSPTEQAHYEASMMVNAGMLEAMDHHIGRLVDYLATRHALEQTIFIITSDNGPEFGDPSTDRAFRLWMAANAYHTDIERLGERGYMGAIGPEWASVAAVPGRLFKMYASEGGTRVPLMISGPGVEPATGFNGAQSFVVDVAPTIADLTGLTSVEPMDGRSLVPLLRATSSEIRSADEAVALEVAGNAAVFQGTHKLTRNTLPHGDARWRLHDIQRDPAERTDLSVARPALAEALLGHYEAYAAAVGVVPVPDDFNVLAQVTSNTVSSMRERYLPRLLLALLAVLAAGIGFWRVRRHKSPLNETETHT